MATYRTAMGQVAASLTQHKVSSSLNTSSCQIQRIALVCCYQFGLQILQFIGYQDYKNKMYVSAPRIKMNVTASNKSQFSFDMESGREKEQHTGETRRIICEILPAQKDGQEPCCVRNIVSLD